MCIRDRFSLGHHRTGKETNDTWNQEVPKAESIMGFFDIVFHTESTSLDIKLYILFCDKTYKFIVCKTIKL